MIDDIIAKIQSSYDEFIRLYDQVRLTDARAL